MTPVDRSRLPELGPDPLFTFPQINKATLRSGLQVWSVPRHEVPVVCCLLVLRYGAAVDPPARPGLAALAGDLLDEGAGARSALELHEALARIGAQFDIEVGPDATLLVLTTLTEFLERALGLLADMVIRPQFDPTEFVRVRELRLSRLTQLRALPAALAERAFFALLYRDHPYGHLPLGTEASLHAARLEEVVAFHRRFCCPARATLAVVGDLVPAAAADIAARCFDGWDPGAPAPVDLTDPEVAPRDPDTALATPSTPPPRLVLVHRLGAPQSELRLGHVAAQRATPDYSALLVLNSVLGGQFVSRINMNLREAKGLTYGARSVFEFRRGPGPFLVQASVQTDATAVAIEEIFEELRAIRGPRPATATEVQVARAALIRGYPRGFETPEQIARAIAQLVVYDLPDDEFSRFVPRVRAVDVDEVAEAARRYLDPDRVLAVIVGDAEAVTRQLAGTGLPAPVSVTIEEAEGKVGESDEGGAISSARRA